MSRPDVLLGEVRASWPALRVDDAEFLAFVAERVDADAAMTHLADLYLACACARGDAAALRAFEHRYMHDVDRVLARFSLEPAEREDLKQALRERLFMTAAGRPRIAAYTGTGSLAAWVRAVSSRMALDVLRKRRRARARDDRSGPMPAMFADPLEPDLAWMKQSYAGQFQAAFAEAVTAIAPAERVLLRLHYIDGVSTEQIARMEKVHPVTVLRRLGRARDHIIRRTREALLRRIDVTPSQVDSIVRLVRSELDVTLSRLLGSGGAEA